MNLSWGEWAGVTAVGFGLAYAARTAANAQESDEAHQTAMLIGGTLLYVVGVGIGASRPAEGWYQLGSSTD